MMLGVLGLAYPFLTNNIPNKINNITSNTKRKFLTTSKMSLTTFYFFWNIYLNVKIVEVCC